MPDLDQVNQIKWPRGYGMKDLVAYGNTGLIVLDRSTNTVFKAPHDDELLSAITIEREIYERFVYLGGHKGVLCYYGTYDSGIRLEYASTGDVRSYLEGHSVDEARKLRWAVQLAEALNFVHKCGVIHGDVNGFNVLLDQRLDAKLADFAGSSLDGSPLLVGVRASHEYPGPAVSHQADIFALGSTIYEIMTGHLPYAKLSDEKISERYAKGKFPKTASLGVVGGIIKGCWKGNYKDTSEVVQDLKAARHGLLTFHGARFAKSVTANPALAVAAVAIVTVSAFYGLRLARGRLPSG